MNTDGTARMTYELSNLTSGQVEAVYPLVRHHVDGLETDGWRAFVLPLIDAVAADGRPPTGIVVAGRHRAARGMFAYMRLPHLGPGRPLMVPHAFCTELLRTAPLWSILLAEMTRIARDLSCAMIRLIAHRRCDELDATLRQAGNGQMPIELLQAEPRHPA